MASGMLFVGVGSCGSGDKSTLVLLRAYVSSFLLSLVGNHYDMCRFNGTREELLLNSSHPSWAVHSPPPSWR